MAETARRAADRDPRRRRDRRRALALWKLRLVVGAALLRDHHRRRDAPERSTGSRGTASRGRPASRSTTSSLARRDRRRARLRRAARADQVDHALSPSGKAEIARAAKHSTGVKHQVLTALQKRLKHLPRRSELVKPATQIGPKAFEVVIGIFFTLRRRCLLDLRARQDGRRRLLAHPATEAQEGARHVDADRPAARRVRARAGAADPGASAIALSLLFWAIGEPYWILVGAFAGLVEIVP